MTRAESELKTLVDQYNYHKTFCNQCRKQKKGDSASLVHLCVKGVDMFRCISQLSKGKK